MNCLKKLATVSALAVVATTILAMPSMASREGDFLTRQASQMYALQNGLPPWWFERNHAIQKRAEYFDRGFRRRGLFNSINLNLGLPSYYSYPSYPSDYYTRFDAY